MVHIGLEDFEAQDGALEKEFWQALLTRDLASIGSVISRVKALHGRWRQQNLQSPQSLQA